MRGLPHAFRDVEAPLGATVQLEVAGNCGGAWLLARGDAAWAFAPSHPAQLTASVFIPQEIVWRVFTRGIDRSEALEHSHMQGDRALGERVFHLIAIVA